MLAKHLPQRLHLLRQAAEFGFRLVKLVFARRHKLLHVWRQACPLCLILSAPGAGSFYDGRYGLLLRDRLRFSDDAIALDLDRLITHRRELATIVAML